MKDGVGVKNLRTYCHLVDGSCQDLDYATGKELISQLLSDDWGPPLQSFAIAAKADDGRVVTIAVPYDDSERVHVVIEQLDLSRV